MSSLISSKRLKFFKGHYNLLLICLVILFAFRPYHGGTVYLAIWKLLITGTILAAIFNCKHSHKIKIAETCIAIPAVLLYWWDLYSDQPWSLIATSLLSVLFSFLCTISIIADVMTKTKVTFETLRGVICAFFLVAIGFAYLFWVLEYITPGSFANQGQPYSIFDYAESISSLLYFSFVTLLTIGYGDIIAVKDVAQTAVVFEGMTGQFYVAILVARLVSLYSLSDQIKILQSMKGNKEK
jgi:hypothetical protein